MTQAELNRAVAQATGESVDTISHHGFSVLEPLPEREPLVIDWDEQAQYRRTFHRRRRRKAESAY